MSGSLSVISLQLDGNDFRPWMRVPEEHARITVTTDH
jgi:hypothetical protein